MNTWKGAFVAVLLSGVVFGMLNGHLALWTAVGATLGAVLAGRERIRTIGSSSDQAGDATSLKTETTQMRGNG